MPEYITGRKKIRGCKYLYSSGLTKSEYQKAWREDHREQNKAYAKAYYGVNKTLMYARGKRRHFETQYNLMTDEYNALLDTQANCCAICGDEFVETKKIHVDHDHTTGRVRAILCERCNHGLAKFRDSAYLLEKAAEYLLRHRIT